MEVPLGTPLGLIRDNRSSQWQWPPQWDNSTHHITKTAQEWPGEHEKDLKESTWPSHSSDPNLTDTSKGLDRSEPILIKSGASTYCTFGIGIWGMEKPDQHLEFCHFTPATPEQSLWYGKVNCPNGTQSWSWPFPPGGVMSATWFGQVVLVKRAST